MPSRQYSALESGLDTIENQFLDFGNRVDGNYNSRELMNCRAYVAFAHAEFEQFLEDRALALLRRAHLRWGRHQSGGVVLASLMTYRLTTRSGIPDSPNAGAGDNSFACRTEQVFAAQRGAIKANNGIKRGSMAALYMPLGLAADDVEEPLLIQLDNFGVHRGDLVHKSHSACIQTIRDPFSDEKADAQNLLRDLKDFDVVVSRLT